MKLMRIITAAVLLTAILLNSLPDSVLDVFHEHEHTHHCAPNQGDLKTIENEHIHCKNPHLFFQHYIQPEPAAGIVSASYPVTYRAVSYEEVVVWHHLLPGRSPPVPDKC